MYEAETIWKKHFVIIYYVLFFLVFFLFFTIVHPLYIFDSDDWGNMGLMRSVFPRINSFNPIKVFPEVLFTFISFLSARIVYPLTGDYISSLCFVYALFYSFVILCNAMCIHWFLKYVYSNFKTVNSKDESLVILCLITIFFLCLFYFGRNGDYLLHEVNVTCIFHYSIPAILNFSVVLLLISFEKKNKQIFCFESTYKNVLFGVILYLCIFSNLFISSVLLSYVVFYLLKRIYFLFSLKSYNRAKKIYGKLILQNYQYFLVMFIWCLSAYFESTGGRAKIGINNHFSIQEIFKSVSFFFNDVLYFVSFGKISFVGIIIFVSANLHLLYVFFKKKISTIDKKYLFIQLTFCWFVSFIVLYFLLLSVKTGVSYQIRSSLVYCWFVWIILELICSFIYLSIIVPKLNSFVPVLIIVLLYRVCIHNSVLIETNLVPKSNINSVKVFGNDLIKNIEAADRSGLSEIKLYVPKFDSSDNFPFAVYSGISLANSMYLQGITKRLLSIEIVPDEKINVLYSIK